MASSQSGASNRNSQPVKTEKDDEALGRGKARGSEEIKSETNRLSQAEIKWEEKIRSRGVIVFVCVCVCVRGSWEGRPLLLASDFSIPI